MRHKWKLGYIVGGIDSLHLPLIYQKKKWRKASAREVAYYKPSDPYGFEKTCFTKKAALKHARRIAAAGGKPYMDRIDTRVPRRLTTSNLCVALQNPKSKYLTIEL